MIDQRAAKGRKLLLLPLSPSQPQDQSRLALLDSTRENCDCTQLTSHWITTASREGTPAEAREQVVVADIHPRFLSSPTSSSSPSSSSTSTLPPSLLKKKKRRDRAVAGHMSTRAYYYDVIKPPTPTTNPLTKIIREGNELYRQGAYPAALGKFTAAIAAQRPREQPSLYLCRSETLFKLERYREAISDANKAIELRSTFWEAWIILLDAQLALKDRHACNETCRRLMASMAGPSCYISTEECGTRIKAFAKVDEVMGILSTQCTPGRFPIYLA